MAKSLSISLTGSGASGPVDWEEMTGLGQTSSLWAWQEDRRKHTFSHTTLGGRGLIQELFPQTGKNALWSNPGLCELLFLLLKLGHLYLLQPASSN